MQKNKIEFNCTVNKLVAVSLIAFLWAGNTNLCATAQSEQFAYLANDDLTATLRNRAIIAMNEPYEGREAISNSLYSRGSEAASEQNEIQPERRFYIQEEETLTENEVQTNQPRTFFQVVTNFLKRAFGFCFKGIFGASKEN